MAFKSKNTGFASGRGRGGRQGRNIPSSEKELKNSQKSELPDYKSDTKPNQKSELPDSKLDTKSKNSSLHLPASRKNRAGSKLRPAESKLAHELLLSFGNKTRKQKQRLNSAAFDFKFPTFSDLVEKKLEKAREVFLEFFPKKNCLNVPLQSPFPVLFSTTKNPALGWRQVRLAK